MINSFPPDDETEDVVIVVAVVVIEEEGAADADDFLVDEAGKEAEGFGEYLASSFKISCDLDEEDKANEDDGVRDVPPDSDRCNFEEQVDDDLRNWRSFNQLGADDDGEDSFAGDEMAAGAACAA